MTDWQHIATTILLPFEQQIRATPQSAEWHAEGDVYVHTQKVIDVLHGMSDFQALSSEQQHLLHIAALLHDIGKIQTTRWEDNDWHAPHHAPVGSRMTRKLLWKQYGLAGSAVLMQQREAVCLLIRYHSFPVHAIDLPDGRQRLLRIAADGLMTPLFSVRLLCLLSKADMLGRECVDQQEALEKIVLCEEMAKEEGCYEKPFPFRSAHLQRAFLSGRDVWKEQELYDDTWGEVILMSGLPGTGKDTWIARNANDLPMVSLDAIRQEKRISPRANQGLVANIAREQAKTYLRAHQPFVWNATNITQQMRESLVSLFESYRAHVHIVYLETEWDTLMERNNNRDEAVPTAEIEKMLAKLTPPEPREAKIVEWLYV